MRTKLTAVMFFALLFHCTSGFAAIYGIDNLFLNPGFLAEVTPVKAQPLIGQYDLTFLGKEAAYNNSLLRMPGSEVIFKNSVTAVGETKANMDIASLWFESGLDGARLAANVWPDDDSCVRIFKLMEDMTVNSIFLTKGMYLIGFNDMCVVDRDFDDMIISAKAVPVPGAVWLLGAGLAGVIGMRRRNKA